MQKVIIHWILEFPILHINLSVSTVPHIVSYFSGPCIPNLSMIQLYLYKSKYSLVSGRYIHKVC